MKTNIVIFEINPEHLDVFRVPESTVPAATLRRCKRLPVFASTATTRRSKTGKNFHVVNDALAVEARATNGVEELKFPFQPLPGETVFHVFMAM